MKRNRHQFTINRRLCRRCHDQATMGRAHHVLDASLDFPCVSDTNRSQFHSERWRDGLDSAQLASSCGYRGVSNDRLFQEMNSSGDSVGSEYPPAEPGALGLVPLKAACPCRFSSALLPL
jgi:hypothetical protein